MSKKPVPVEKSDKYILSANTSDRASIDALIAQVAKDAEQESHQNMHNAGIAGFDDPIMKEYWHQGNHTPVQPQKASWLEKTSGQALKNLTEGSRTGRIVRGAGIGLGAVYTVIGASHLLSPKKQPVANGEEVDIPTPSKSKALLQIAAGVGIMAAAAFLKVGKGASPAL
jgi:hypothetical protein